MTDNHFTESIQNMVIIGKMYKSLMFHVEYDLFKSRIMMITMIHLVTDEQ
jgi:hypothetical protein